MIVRDKPRPLDLLLAIRGSILPRIAPAVALQVLFACLVVFAHRQWGWFTEVGAVAFSTFGVALSLFLGFRNNAAYDRWWEARKLWGGLLADLRALAREVELFVPDENLRSALLRNALAFLHLHRATLRGLVDDPQALLMGGSLCEAPHPPEAALDLMARDIAAAGRAGLIEGFGLRTLAERLASITAQHSSCERIATTPLPYVYSLLIYRTTWVFCLLLPLALVGPVGWMTPVFVGIVGYAFLGLAEVTEDLTHPFGLSPNALPLDAICRAAEISLAPHLNEEPRPPLQPINYYLS